MIYNSPQFKQIIDEVKSEYPDIRIIIQDKFDDEGFGGAYSICSLKEVHILPDIVEIVETLNELKWVLYHEIGHIVMRSKYNKSQYWKYWKLPKITKECYADKFASDKIGKKHGLKVLQRIEDKWNKNNWGDKEILPRIERLIGDRE